MSRYLHARTHDIFILLTDN